MGLLEPHGRHRAGDGEALRSIAISGLDIFGGAALAALAPSRMEGRLLGISRRDTVGGPIELVETASISLTTGSANDARGIRRPNGSGKRQVTVISREDWAAACDEAGETPDWTKSRRNLLVEGLTLVHTTGRHLRIGDALLEITGECDPCWKMDRVLPGLQAAMRTQWRGGVTCRVLAEGDIAVGDTVTLES